MLEEKKGVATEWEFEEEGGGEGEGGEGGGEGTGEGEGTPNNLEAIKDDAEYTLEDGSKITGKELKAGYMRQSDYTKKAQELAEEKKKLGGEGGKKEGKDESPFSDEDRKTARYLLKIAMEDKELREEFGLVTEKDLARREIVQKLSSEATALTKEFDGKNGLPKFDEEKVLEHMHQEGFRSMKKAFIDMIQDTPEYIKYLTDLRKGNSGYHSENRGTKPAPKKKEYKNTPEGFKENLGDLFDDLVASKEEK